MKRINSSKKSAERIRILIQLKVKNNKTVIINNIILFSGFIEGVERLRIINKNIADAPTHALIISISAKPIKIEFPIKVAG